MCNRNQTAIPQGEGYRCVSSLSTQILISLMARLRRQTTVTEITPLLLSEMGSTFELGLEDRKMSY